MSWKDYFYFDRRDRQGVILLLVLIFLVWIAYSLLKKENTSTALTEEYKEQFQASGDEIEETPAREFNPVYPVKLKAGEFIAINTADTTLLKQIPGIGSAYARRIVDYRHSLGGYTDVAQLREVWGVDDELYRKTQAYITIDGEPKRLKINTLSEEALRKHPYLDYKQAKVIVDIRRRKGAVSSINRLALLDEFTDEDIKRLKPYLSFH